MENASKALIMAAGILIGLLILSLTVYLFASFGTTSAQIHRENEQRQIDQFNIQFTSYVGKEGITIYDVVTLANLATETNIYYEFDDKHVRQSPQNATDNYISVYFQNKYIEKKYGDSAKEITNYYNELIRQDLENMSTKIDENGISYQVLTEYKCFVEISPVTRKSISNKIH